MMMDIIARGLATSGGSGGDRYIYRLQQIDAEKDNVATYVLFQSLNGGTYAEVPDSVHINIPIDNFAKEGILKEVTEQDNPVVGYKIGDKYLDIVISEKDNKHVYILVTDLTKGKAEDVAYNPSKTILTATNVQSALDEVGILVTPDTDATVGRNGMMSKIDKKKLDTYETMSEEGMRMEIDLMFEGFDLPELDTANDDGIADEDEISSLF